MKNYEITAIWTEEIASVSRQIDEKIDRMREEIATNEITIKETEEGWLKQSYIDDNEKLKQRIETLDWIINTINAPFKIKK